MANPSLSFLVYCQVSLTIKTINFVNIIHLLKKKIQFFVQKRYFYIGKLDGFGKIDG